MIDIKPSGEKRDIRGVDKPSKLRLTEAISVYDRANKGMITLKQI